MPNKLRKTSTAIKMYTNQRQISLIASKTIKKLIHRILYPVENHFKPSKPV